MLKQGPPATCPRPRMSISHDGSPDPGGQGVLGIVSRLPFWRLHGEVAQQSRGGLPRLPSTAPDLDEGAGVAEDLADLGLALRDA